MGHGRDEDIRRRAHELWEQEGRPHGKDSEHWERARREIEDGAAAPVPAKRRAPAKTAGAAKASGTGSAKTSAARKPSSKPKS